MMLTLALLIGLGEPQAPAVASLFQQISPAMVNGDAMRSPDCTRAVVLIHGYHIHLQDKHVPKAELRPWQKRDSTLVKELAKHADVYALAYGQNVTIETIVAECKLREGVARLRKLGYRDIVLIGHSAGGLVARQFVEDCPDAGVTRVVQVCAPNGGSPLAGLYAPKSQKIFLQCLTEQGRQDCLKKRAEKRIPDKVEFVCVVGATEALKRSDGVVSCVCQWTDDLQKQGVPAVRVAASHRAVVRDAQVAETLARLCRETQPRWTATQIEEARKEILRK